MKGLNFDDIRRQVAIEHNVVLGKDDPILVSVTINEMVLKRYLEMASEGYEAASKGLLVSLHHQLEQEKAAAKETAGRLITEASDHVAVQVKQAVDTAISTASAKIVQQVEAAQSAEREATYQRDRAEAAWKGAWIAAGLSALIALAAVATLALTMTTN